MCHLVPTRRAAVGSGLPLQYLQGLKGYKEELVDQRGHTSYREERVQTKVRFLFKCS